MRADTEILPPGQVDPKLLHKLFYVDHFCLFTAMIIAAVGIFPGVFAQIQGVFPASWLDMRSSWAAMTVCAAIALFLTEETQTKKWQWVGRIFGMLTAMIAGALFLAGGSALPAATVRVLDRNQVALREGSLEFSAFLFLMVSIAILLVSSQKKVMGHIADVVAILLSAVVLTLILRSVFALTGVENTSARPIAIPVLWCLALLTLVVIFRRTERGFLSVLFGYGTGSRIARLLAPVLLVLPVTREIARAHLLSGNLIPAQYTEAVLTSIATVLGLILLLALARLINRMQENIQGMTLRDELTGLHSVRGFYLLGEQAFRYSRRVKEPFGVLFVDMDNLKSINDQLGHSAGSVSLVETARLLEANFRDTDVIGRVGGDEFVVAGQFNEQDLAATIERLREAVARKNQAAGKRFSISLSMGYAVTESSTRDTLQNLVKQADEAMYKEKHAKKKRQSAMATPRVVTS